MDVIELKNQQTLLTGSATLPVDGEGSANDAEAPEFFLDEYSPLS